MRISPATILAAPVTVEHFGELRDGIEHDINRHNRRLDPLIGHVLASLQGGFNQAVKRDGIDVAPLCRRINTNEVMA